MRKNRLLLLCLLVFCSVFLVSCAPAEVVEKYKEAKTLYDSGKYSEASKLFQELSELEKPYKDSEKRYNDCQYNFALQSIDKLNYTEAINQLSAIVDKPIGITNSAGVAEEINKCYYCIAEDYIEAEDYDAARENYLKAEGYSDSAKKADKCIEQKEEQLKKFQEWTERVNKRLEKYGIPVLEDLVYNSVNYKRSYYDSKYDDSVGSYVTFDKVCVSSSEFENLSLPDKLTVIEVIQDETLGCDFVHEVFLNCNGSEYSAKNIDRSYYLLKDGSSVYNRLIIDSPTNENKGSSTKKSSSSGSSSTSGGSGWGKCSKCHSKTATHGAYCDDCYYGEVSDLADKGIGLHEMEMWANGYTDYDDAYGYSHSR